MTTARMMRAVMVHEGRTGPDALYVGEMPVPSPGADEILIHVASAGLNRADVDARQGNYPPLPGISEVIGLEVGGTVAAVGDAVTRWKVGDRVCALLGGGGYAEYAVAHEGSVLPVPEDMDLADAGALPETVFTVYTNVFERGRLAPGETLLVHGGNSGIGVTALLAAKAYGARTIATVRGEDKAEKARSIGADIVIDVTHADFEKIVLDAGGADVILDIVGAPYFDRNIRILKTDGRLSFVAGRAGSQVAFDIDELMVKRLTITGSTLRYRPYAEKARLGRGVEASIWPYFFDRRIEIPIDRKFPLEDIAEAHAYLESNRHFGKILLTM